MKKKQNEKKVYKKREAVRRIICIIAIAFLINLINYSVGINVKYSSKEGGVTQIYWDFGDDFSEDHSKIVRVDEGRASFLMSRKDVRRLERLRIDIPADEKKICRMRSVSFSIYGIDMFEYTADELLEMMSGRKDIEDVSLSGQYVKMKIDGVDPYFVFIQKFTEDIKKNIEIAFWVIHLVCSVVIYLVAVVLWKLFQKNREKILQWIKNCSLEKLAVRHILAYLFSIVLLVIGYIGLFVYRFFAEQFDDISFGEILFHLKVPIKGTGESIFEEIFEFIRMPVIIGTIVLIIFIALFLYFKIVRNNKITVRAVGCAVGVFWIVTISLAFRDFGVISYLKAYSQKSAFIEEEYTDPDTVSLHFPEKKRNLIYIYLESMESTFISEENGGTMKTDLIPELTRLAQDNINFSEDELVGGAFSTTGTTWTVGAMTAQTSGIPLLLPIDGNSYDKYESFLPGAVSLGDLLEREGYNQEIMVGSDINFGGRKIYFTQHGNYKIWDYNTARKQKKIAKDYYVWWGYEDQKLYKFAKEEILEMAKQEEPFNFTMLTVDTHHIGGYLCKQCPDSSDVPYENVLACASRQLDDFITWLKKQDFYEDTTIVVSGDHPTMDSEYISEHYRELKPRRVYNCIIHSVVETEHTKNRKYTTMDLYPTTLAALGVTIEGERLGLGTNLFSEKKTLAEEYGYEKLDGEFQKRSKFYNETILGQ